jgi:putative transposase
VGFAIFVANTAKQIFEMDDKFQNKYRIPSARLQTWNYGSNAAYFVTICTKNREFYFGEIADSKMVLSNRGIIADVFWHEIKSHSKGIILDEYVVMPNHIHGILIITENDQFDNVTPTIGQQRFQNQGKNSLSSIIGSYKSAVSKHAHRLGFDFEWQTRFHDHIIRTDESYWRIKNYIINNVQNWKDDKFYG